MGRVKRTTGTASWSRYVGLEELSTYLGIGRENARRIGTESKAKIVVGRRSLYDLRKIDEYMESLWKEQHDS